MSGMFELFGFPPHPVGVVLIILCALLWGLRSRLKGRPYLLAFQAAVVSRLLSRIFITFQADGFTPAGMLEDIVTLTIGQFLMFWFLCWLIISLVFAIRKRNDSANIFTRSRNK